LGVNTLGKTTMGMSPSINISIACPKRFLPIIVKI
jgi:hypothetical protein